MRTTLLRGDGDDSPAQRMTSGSLPFELAFAAVWPVAPLVASYPLSGLGLVAGLALVVCVIRVARRRRVGVRRTEIWADTD